MSIPAATAFGLGAYEDLVPLPVAVFAPRMHVDIEDEPSIKKFHDALSEEFTLMLRRFNGGCKTIIAFNLGEFAMILKLQRRDSKVDVVLKVMKKIGTPAVGPGVTMEVVRRMYAMTQKALDLPRIKVLVGERVCDNKVQVRQSVLDYATQNGGCITEFMFK
jgi:hypothetical protein